ncbi:MAG: glycogen synthase GlgA, partial [Vescimonas sp.]|uniref:glycogen synthase GlgA n=1 Tax=Vescimonas sp. TaxID=2892404 RepID=UPI002A90E8AF
MRVLYVTSEAYPFCKTGGLADVAGSLPPALARSGVEAAVILPLYDRIGEQWRRQMTFRRYIYVDLGWRHEYCGLFSLERQGVTWYFVDNEKYFRRGRLYGEFDDGERFAFFSHAVIDLLPSLDWMPDVLHCNDWQTALVPIYLKDVATRWPEVRGIRTVFTIHNIEYQGRYGADSVDQLFGLNRGWYDGGTLRMDGDVNLMKGAMLMANAVTTVSPTYAAQLHDPRYAEGLESVVDAIGWKMHGVVNGIDTEGYDPASDPALPAHYTPGDMGGKAVCKSSLQTALGLHQEPDTPLIAMVTRLVGHKGLDLVQQAMDGIMATGCQFVVLGTGDRQYEDFFRWKAGQYPGRLSVQILYAEDLSRRVYAAADLFLMPSRSEPCGLSQMIAMRYGTVPIVRETGGLKDTVFPYNKFTGEGRGFTFTDINANDMLWVIREAVDLYYNNKEAWRGLQKEG